jgi:hypothetical protein
MKARRADRKLHLELLRARAAADRIELSLATHEIAERLDPLRRAVDTIGSVAGALGGRGRALGWLVAAGAALARSRWTRRAIVGAATGLRAGPTPVRIVALGALAAGLVAWLIRRPRRPELPDSEREPAASRDGETV